MALQSMGSWAVRILTWASVLICAISNVANLHVGMKHINSAFFILTNLGCICASKKDLLGLIKDLEQNMASQRVKTHGKEHPATHGRQLLTNPRNSGTLKVSHAFKKLFYMSLRTMKD